jgi:hypothetical protein
MRACLSTCEPSRTRGAYECECGQAEFVRHNSAVSLCTSFLRVLSRNSTRSPFASTQHVTSIQSALRLSCGDVLIDAYVDLSAHSAVLVVVVVVVGV